MRPECSLWLPLGLTYCLGGHWRNPANPTEQGLDPLFRVKIFNIPQCGATSGRERGREGREERATVFACVNRLWELKTSVWRGGSEGGGLLHYSSKEQFETKGMTVRVFPVDGGYVMQW